MDPLKLIREAIRAVPAVKYALGVAGIAAVVAIVLGLKLSPQFAVFGTLIVLGLMFILVLFSQYAGATERTSGVSAGLNPVGVLVWFYTVALVVVTSLFIPSYFWHVPPYPFASTSQPNSASASDREGVAAGNNEFKPMFGPTPIDQDATYTARVAWVNLVRCQAEYCDVRVYLRAWSAQSGAVLVNSSADIPSWSEGKPDSLTPAERKEGIKPVSMRYPNLEQGQIAFLGKDTVMVQMGCMDSQGKQVFGSARELDAHDLHGIYPVQADCGWVSLEMGFSVDRGKAVPPKFPANAQPPK